MKGFLLSIASALILTLSCSSPKIAVLSISTQEEEQQALISALSKYGNVRKITETQINNLSDDILWIHSIDSNLCHGISGDELGMGVRSFLEKGGKLVLSMDAVNLLNAWGIEEQKIEQCEYECVDSGFGRKLGFHSRFFHSLFEGLNGGAYTWHGKEDNVCRINAFLGDNFPKADSAKVIACQWEYVYLKPDIKVIWETPYKKGTILCIGSCLYYSKENHDRAILDKFTENVVSYLSEGPSLNSKQSDNYWEPEKPELVALHHHHDTPCRICAAEYSKVKASEPCAIEIPSSEYVLKRKATDEYADVISKHSMIILPEKGGVEEIWSHPFMSIRDFKLSVLLKDSNELVMLNNRADSIECYPHAVVRWYNVSGTKIKEVVSTSSSSSTTVIHYEWDTDKVIRLYAEFKSNLRMMWPYDERVLGSLYYTWSEELNAIVIKDSKSKHVSIVGANVPGQVVSSGRYDGFSYENSWIKPIKTDLLQLSAAIKYETEGLNVVDFVLSAGAMGEANVLTNYEQAMLDPSSVITSLDEYYSNWLSKVVSVNTPDEEFNLAFQWAQISSSQFISDITGPHGQHTALLAGYSSSRRGWGGSHRVSGRPGYAWFFGRDSEWASFAFADMGDFDTVKGCIELLLSYQAPDGKIYHELSTSGVAHYDAADATPLLVVLASHYLRASGDIEFIRKYYKQINKAMEYCFSTDRNNDSLIENTCVGHGWLEGGSLWGFETEFYLCGIWEAALREAAYISETLGEKQKAEKYKYCKEVVSNAVEKFWNEEKGWYNYSLNADGTYQDEFLVLTAVPLFLGVLDDTRSKTMSMNYLDPRISTDWGARSVFEDSEAHGGGAYHPRHVWPLFTGWQSLAEYKEGFFDQGFSSLYSSLMTYKTFSYGHIPEVINGDQYRNNGITQHQCWSETMTIMPFLEGTLGFRPDALSSCFELSPRIPLGWSDFQVHDLACGEGRVSMSFERRKMGNRFRATYLFESNKELMCDFAPRFAHGVVIKEVKVNGKEVDYSITDVDAGSILNMAIPVKSTEIEVIYDEGIAPLPIYVQAEKNQPSSGFRLLNQHYNNDVLELVLSGRYGSSHEIDIWAPNGVKSIEGADLIQSQEDGILKLHVVFPKEGSGLYAKMHVYIKK